MSELNIINEPLKEETPDFQSEFQQKLPEIRQRLETEKQNEFNPQQDLPEALINYALITLYHLQEKQDDPKGIPGKAVEHVWRQLTDTANETWNELADTNIQAALTKNFYFKLKEPGALDNALEYWKKYQL